MTVTGHLAVALGILLLAATPAPAEPDLELRAAQQELKLAKSYLQSLSRRHGGHRNQALDHIRDALHAVRLALLDAASAREHGTAPHQKGTKDTTPVSPWWRPHVGD